MGKTLKREIMEEVGIDIQDDITYLGDGTFIRVSGHNVIALTFLCKWKAGVAKALEDQEEVKWLTFSELKNFKELPTWTVGRFGLLEKYLKNKNRK